MWTSDFKEQLLRLPFLKTIEEFHTEDEVRFDVTLNKVARQVFLSDGDSIDSLLRKFHLTSLISIRNMHLYSPAGRLERYEDPNQILKAFFPVRLGFSSFIECRILQKEEGPSTGQARTRAEDVANEAPLLSICNLWAFGSF